MATRLDNRPDQESDNKIQQDYDDKFNELTSPEHMSKDGEEPNLYDRESKPDQDTSAPLSEAQQAKADNKDDGENNSLYEQGPDSSKPTKNKIKGAFTGKKKYGWIGGGIVGMLVAALMFLFPVLGPLHIFSNLFEHNFDFNDSYRRNRTTRIIRSIFSSNQTNRTLDDTPFKLKADLVDFEKFETRMQSKGWDFDYNSEGKPIGLIKPDGTRANFDDPDVRVRTEINDLVKDTIPAWQMNKRVRTRSLITTFTGPRRSFSWSNLLRRDKTAEPDFKTAEFKKQAGLDDIDVDGKITVRDNVDGGGNSPADKALQATVDAKLDGATDAAAINAGVTEAKNSATPSGGRTSLVIGTVVLGCIAYSVNQNQLAASFERYSASLRYSAAFMLAVNEMQQGGDIDVGEVGELFGEYNNYESTTITANDFEDSAGTDGSVVYEESDDEIEVNYDNNIGTFAEGAAWQRATGSPVNGPEINDEFRVLPTSTPLDLVQGIMGMLGAVGGFISTIPFFGQVCSVLQSGFGFIVGIAFDLIEGIFALAACATGAGCVLLGKFALVELLWEVGTRMISAAIAGFGGFLTDNPVQAAAILDQSLNLTASEESRTATPVDSPEYNMQVAAYKHDQNLTRSFAQRYFDMDNSRSLAFTLANLKTSFSRTSFSPSSLVASLLNLPGSSLAAAVSSENAYAQADLDFDNYDFQKYSFNNDYADVDPYDNAEAALALIEDDDTIYLDGDNGDYARDFAVMCMGYVVEAGEVDKSSTNRSFLPMFSDPEAFTNAESRNEAFNAVCIEQANEQKDLYSQIGRFVDDMELIQSMSELSSLQN